MQLYMGGRTFNLAKLNFKFASALILFCSRNLMLIGETHYQGLPTYARLDSVAARSAP